ncbi:MAG: hypothetical protein VXV90_01900 [Pseudomonadota bacterium]|nr:hypothetical protein [Pseudomonadota bacterium]
MASGDGYTIWTHEHNNLELANKVYELQGKLNKIEKINNEEGATALTKQVMIKSIIEGVRPEVYRSFNTDEGEE